MTNAVISLKHFARRKSYPWTLFAGWWVLRALPECLDERWLRWMKVHKQYFLRSSR